jgi:hypothetical protein
LCAARLEARRRAMRAASAGGYSAGAALGLSEDWPAAAGLRARVFRGLRHLIRLSIDKVLDLRTAPAQSLQEMDNLGDFLLAESSYVRMSR